MQFIQDVIYTYYKEPTITETMELYNLMELWILMKKKKDKEFKACLQTKEGRVTLAKQFEKLVLDKINKDRSGDQ